MIRLCGACDGDGVNPEERDIPCRECDGAGVKETDGAADYPAHDPKQEVDRT